MVNLNLCPYFEIGFRWHNDDLLNPMCEQVIMSVLELVCVLLC